MTESTRTLEFQPSIEDPHTRVASLQTQNTELMVIDQYKWTYTDTHHELDKMARTLAELIEEQTKNKLQRFRTEQLFRRSPGSETAPHIIVISGVAGIGKTTMVQKIMFDWARGTQYQKFAFVFLFKFKELNLLDMETEAQMSLTRLIVRHYKYLNNSKLKEILQKPKSLLFVFDGLDEYKHKLDFTQEWLCTNPDDYFPVHILVTSLIRGTLLKGCTVLITTRPTALEDLDIKSVDRFAEILGFFPEQRLMYFKKFFGDADQGAEAFRYVEENAILYTMCFNPSYCWIVCSVMKSHLMTPEEERGPPPRTITDLFVMFLHNILNNHKGKDKDLQEILVKLGKMAFYGVTNRILVFYDQSEMSTFGLQPVLSCPLLSGFLKEILQREDTLEYTTYTFYHLTLQEFMAALSFYLSPSGSIEELLDKLDSCKDGRFEMLTRFLAGLARPSVFKTLGGIMGEFERKTPKRILEWVKKKAEQVLQGYNNSQAPRVCHWLCETQNERLIRDAIGKDLEMSFRYMNLSSLDSSVLGSVISCCGEFNKFNLTITHLTPECIRRLALSRCGLISECLFTSESCSALSLALSTEHSRLTDLDLNGSELEDSGVSELCEGLKRYKNDCRSACSNCSLTLTLSRRLGLHFVSLVLHSLTSCLLKSGCCSVLSLALSDEHSQLIELDLSYNGLEDSGVNELCEGLRSKNCEKQTITLHNVKC
uniref:NACHT domain-containing protein n=1 Tax=Erpetoichthys calabaricus TaxID=27687 RepID=A0A8C4T8W7_ERPCA